MRTVRIALVTAVMVVPLLAACSADSNYCDAVESGQPELMDATQRSAVWFSDLSTVSRDIAEMAPEEMTGHWTAISEATAMVAAEHRSAGIYLDDSDEGVQETSLSQEQIDGINEAYGVFNDTQADRRAVVEDVLERCKIDLADIEEKK